jgi:myo-inositol 2-dehydrogenase / D-chiro-inositol 1-dehydrogenase
MFLDAPLSGGIFVDCNIHDIDLALWFLSLTSKSLPIPKSISAIGITAVSPVLQKYNDVDNGLAIIEFHNGRMAFFYGSRMMSSGQHDMSEIIGTKGKIVVNGQPSTNLVEIWERNGVRKEIPNDYYGRFEMAFVEEGKTWVNACLDDLELPFDLEGAVTAIQIACALQESLVTGKKIWFDERGKRVEKANL